MPITAHDFVECNQQKLSVIVECIPRNETIRYLQALVRILVEVIPFEFAAAEHVEVQVRDLLAAVFAVVGDETVAAGIQPERTGDLLGKCRQPGHRLGIDILKALNVLFGDDQHMDGCFGVEVMKGEKIIVFQHGVVGDIPRDDLTENTHGCILGFNPDYAIDSISSAPIIDGMGDASGCSTHPPGAPALQPHTPARRASVHL